MTFYTIKQFATLLGVSEETLRKLAKSGKLKPFRTITNRPYYTDEHYYKYLNISQGENE